MVVHVIRPKTLVPGAEVDFLFGDLDSQFVRGTRSQRLALGLFLQLTPVSRCGNRPVLFSDRPTVESVVLEKTPEAVVASDSQSLDLIAGAGESTGGPESANGRS